MKGPTMPASLAPAPPGGARVALLIVAAAAGALFAASLALWAYYGTAVFVEMILAGIAACL